MRALCYNCGIREATTRDHIISKTLIPNPRPPNLPTVPACRECNEGFSKDEEYFRDRLAGVIGDPNYKGQSMWNKAWKSMQRKRAKGKKFGLFKDIVQLDFSVLTNEGVSDKGIRMQKKRVNRVIQKIVRGFYYYHFKEQLKGVEFQIDLLSSIDRIRDQNKITNVLSTVLNSPTWSQNYGTKTAVACALASEDRRAGLWIIKLFGGHIVFVLVAPSDYWNRSGKV